MGTPTFSSAFLAPKSARFALFRPILAAWAFAGAFARALSLGRMWTRATAVTMASASAPDARALAATEDRASIEDDVCAAHLAREPAEAWLINENAKKTTCLVRLGRRMPANVDVVKVGRPGTVGRIALFGRTFLWEIASEQRYLLREITRAGEFGVVLRGGTPAQAMRALVASLARDGGVSGTMYSAPGVFGLGPVREQHDRLRDAGAFLTPAIENALLGGPTCGSCRAPLDGQVGQLVGAWRLCRDCVNAAVAASRTLPAVPPTPPTVPRARVVGVAQARRVAPAGTDTTVAAASLPDGGDVLRAYVLPHLPATPAPVRFSRGGSPWTRPRPPAREMPTLAGSFPARPVCMPPGPSYPASGGGGGPGSLTPTTTPVSQAAGHAARTPTMPARLPFQSPLAADRPAAQPVPGATVTGSYATESYAPPHSLDAAMLLVDHVSVGSAFVAWMRCKDRGCGGQVQYAGLQLHLSTSMYELAFCCCAHPDDGRHGVTVGVPLMSLVGDRNQAVAQLMAAGLVLSGTTYSQFEAILAFLHAVPPVPERTFYRRQAEFTAALEDVRDRHFDGVLAGLRGRSIVVSTDFTWSTRREARMGTCVWKQADNGHVLDVQHVVVGERPAGALASPRVHYFGGSSKAMESIACEIVARRFVHAGVAVYGVAKDDDSTALNAIRKSYPNAAELLDRNHVVKAFKKRIQNAAKTIKALRGRADHLANHLRRMLVAAAEHMDGPQPELFRHLVEAHVRHLAGDCSECPSESRTRGLGPFAGCRFHCPRICGCDRCEPKRLSQNANLEAARARRGSIKAVLTTMPDAVRLGVRTGGGSWGGYPASRDATHKAKCDEKEALGNSFRTGRPLAPSHSDGHVRQRQRLCAHILHVTARGDQLADSPARPEIPPLCALVHCPCRRCAAGRGPRQ